MSRASERFGRKTFYLIEEQVLDLRRRWIAGEPRSSLALFFRINASSVFNIVHRYTQNDLPLLPGEREKMQTLNKGAGAWMLAAGKCPRRGRP